MFNHTNLLRATAVVAAFALAEPAAATVISPTTRSATAAEVEAARTEGDALLKAANAQTVFSNETDASGHGAILLRHRRSGVRCVLFTGRESNKVTVYPSTVRGDDVGCRTSGPADVRNLYIFRAPEKTIEQLLSEAEMELRPVAPDAHPAKDAPTNRPFLSPPGAPLPPHVVSTLVGANGGYVTVLGKLGDWAVEQRYSGPLDIVREVTDRRDIWAATIADARDHPPAPGAEAAAAAPAAERKLSAAEARVQADALIADSVTGAQFANASSADDVAVRHKASHFVCHFPADDPDSAIHVLNPDPAMEDVSCSARRGDAVYSYYVTRAPSHPTLQEALSSYEQEIQRFHPNAKIAAGTWDNVSAKKKGKDYAPPHLSRRFNYSAQGRPVFSRVSVAVVGDWVVEQRVTAPLDRAQATDLAAELEMMTALVGMAGPLN